MEDDCILWGNRVVVPAAGRARVMEELHTGHPGISRMKSLTQSFVCMVARYGLRFRVKGEGKSPMSSESKSPTKCTTSSLDLAKSSLVILAY